MVLAGVLVGMTFLSHLIYGYMAALSLILLAALPDATPRVSRMWRTLCVGAAAAALLLVAVGGWFLVRQSTIPVERSMEQMRQVGILRTEDNGYGPEPLQRFVVHVPPDQSGTLIVPFTEIDVYRADWSLAGTGDQQQVPGQLRDYLNIGDLTSEQMRVIGELASAYGDGTVRVTPEQDLLFRWVNAADLRQLYRRLAAASLGLGEAGTVADVTSCPGAESCRLAVTQSRGLGRLLEQHLRAHGRTERAAAGIGVQLAGRGLHRSRWRRRNSA